MKNAIKYEVGKTYQGVGEVKGIEFKLLNRKSDTCLFKRSDSWYEVILLHVIKEETNVYKGWHLKLGVSSKKNKVNRLVYKNNEMYYVTTLN